MEMGLVKCLGSDHGEPPMLAQEVLIGKQWSSDSLGGQGQVD